MSALRIRISSFLDSSWDRVLPSIAGTAERAGRKVRVEGEKAAAAQEKAAKGVAFSWEKAASQMGAAQERASKNAARLAARDAAIADRAIAQITAAREKAASAQERISAQTTKTTAKDQAEASKATARAWAEEAKEFEKAQKKKATAAGQAARIIEDNYAKMAENLDRDSRRADRTMDILRGRVAADKRASRTAMVDSVGRGVGTGLSVAAGAARQGLSIIEDIAGGAGVDLSLGSLVGKNVAGANMAQTLSNSGYMPGQSGPNGQRVSANQLMSEAGQIGTNTGFETNDVLGGFQKFTALSGDLDTARKVMGDIARLSRATGTDIEAAAAAAGNMDMELGDIPNKSERISQIMRAIAGQGKLGAVEISDMASQMAKLAASAGRFEGDVGNNIALLGAFAQEARQRGGAASATQAATSVQGLINTLVTPARAAAFHELTGKKTTNAQGLVRDPETLLMETLRASKGDPEKFKKVFYNSSASRSVEGFATLYRQAGGGSAGEAAVTAEFKRLKEVAMSLGEVEESFNLAMSQSSAKVTQLNDKLQLATQGIADAVIPALADLAPGLIALGAVVGKMTADLFGFKKPEPQDNSVDYTIAGANGAVRNGSITDEQKDALKAAKIKQDEEVVRRQNEIETYKRSGDMPVNILGYSIPTSRRNSMLGEVLGQDVDYDRVNAMSIDLKTAQIEQGRVNAALAAINEAISGGVMRVEIVRGNPNFMGPQPTGYGGENNFRMDGVVDANSPPNGPGPWK